MFLFVYFGIFLSELIAHWCLTKKHYLWVCKLMYRSKRSIEIIIWKKNKQANQNNNNNSNNKKGKTFHFTLLCHNTKNHCYSDMQLNVNDLQTCLMIVSPMKIGFLLSFLMNVLWCIPVCAWNVIDPLYQQNGDNLVELLWI